MLERQWAYGGHGMSYLFSDIGTDWATNDVGGRVREGKDPRDACKDPVLAEKLCPSYPIGTRRLCLDIGYYETFNRDNVTLVDMRETPIEEITETGIRTTGDHYEVDLLIFALGFKPVPRRHRQGRRPQRTGTVAARRLGARSAHRLRRS